MSVIMLKGGRGMSNCTSYHESSGLNNMIIHVSSLLSFNLVIKAWNKNRLSINFYDIFWLCFCERKIEKEA